MVNVFSIVYSDEQRLLLQREGEGKTWSFGLSFVVSFLICKLIIYNH